MFPEDGECMQLQQHVCLCISSHALHFHSHSTSYICSSCPSLASGPAIMLKSLGIAPVLSYDQKEFVCGISNPYTCSLCKQPLTLNRSRLLCFRHNLMCAREPAWVSCLISKDSFVPWANFNTLQVSYSTENQNTGQLSFLAAEYACQLQLFNCRLW